MTKEELLKPRWKVIADYPFAPPIHAVGTIIEGSLAPEGMEPWENKYPHLFKKLEWWEERKKEEMPDYVKVNYKSNAVGSNENEVIKVHYWQFIDGEVCAIKYESGGGTLVDYLLPATEEEYINQSL